MLQFRFYKAEVPQDVEFTRVHAMLVTGDRRVLLRVKNGEARVTGGHIEAGDRDVTEALRREIREELNVEFDKCDYLGYMEMTDDETGEHEVFARMVARVTQILPPMPDPDRAGNWIYGRVLAPPEIARVELMKNPMFAHANDEVLTYALEVARQNNYWTELPNLEYEVLNPETHD